MPLPLEEHVRLILLEQERGRRLFDAVSDGWAAFNTNYPRRPLWRRKSSARAMMWEEVAAHLVQMDDGRGVRVVEHRDTLSLVLDDEVLVRFKHADTALSTQNVATVEAAKYDDHSVDLFGWSGLQRVRLCYILNQYETELAWVGIAAHNKRQFLWKIELGKAGVEVPPVRLPIEAPEVDTTKLARVKGKASEEDKKKDNG